MADEWNLFVAASKNGTFLFDRHFMDYHSDRFCDHSLLVYRDQRLYALLPANQKDDTLVSHGGLTYGGLVTDSRCSAKGVLDAFTAINEYLRQQGFRHVVYKAVPWIYHQLPAEEDLYALTSVCHARLTIRDISSAIIGDRKIRFSESRKSGIRKAHRQGLTIAESTDFATFWQILNENLTGKYGVRPVHSIVELKLLHSRFDYLINNTYKDYPYIDFGKSTVSDSADLNEQLIFQKEGFGARAVCYDTYEYDL